MKIPLPKGKYISNIEVNDDNIAVSFKKKKRVALLFISLGANYWPYFKQVLEDCKANFLPQHHVDFFLWTDDENFNDERVTVCPTDFVPWPAPTLMRYHLFLQQQEALKDYDYIFYLDADMRVVDRISDEILGSALTVAEHPMYSLRPNYIPPYEPNTNSAAFIPRLGQIVAEGGKSRFRPLYLAGGFQGGTSKSFLKAMRVMRDNIDKDFNNNYTAIWNDESHWNQYVFKHANPIDGHATVVLGPEYVHPDSLIKEYYEPIWGRKLTPKIITITKPFSLSKEGGKALNEFMGKKDASDAPFQCPSCKDTFMVPGHIVKRVVECPGSGKEHQLDMLKV